MSSLCVARREGNVYVHHTETLSVSIARGIELLEIPVCLDEWQDDLTVRHMSSRELIPLATLMADGPR
ncbi:unannotated protein [freshwater metagenome]|uniref:Unannotated protein n=1 Tax=freshwater metagenome TaxID=449393 RepID=A0A6J7NRM0_9ZZZZ